MDEDTHDDLKKLMKKAAKIQLALAEEAEKLKEEEEAAEQE